MRILLVEDTIDVASAIVDSLSRRGHAIDQAPTRAMARDLLSVQQYDLLVLDISLPDGSGMDLLREHRRGRETTPILMLTARYSVDDRIDALEFGADDYLTKPFDLRELEARARALLRRSRDQRSGVLSYGDISLDPSSQMLHVAAKRVILARREFGLLEILLSNRGRVMSKEELFGKLFGFDDENVDLNAVELYISRLRRKLGTSKVTIRTRRNLGYQLVADD